MKKLIFPLITVFGITLFLNGCYTYLALYDDSKLADVVYEPYFPPDDPCPPAPPPPHPPQPKIILIPDVPQEPPYKRPKEVLDIRNGGEGRIPDQNDRRR